jgi:hypothetical protein
MRFEEQRSTNQKSKKIEEKHWIEFKIKYVGGQINN